jgi:hypothetical protein
VIGDEPANTINDRRRRRLLCRGVKESYSPTKPRAVSLLSVYLAGMGNGALPNGPSYRAHPRLYRYYFHLRAGDELTPDEEGIDLPDFSAAQREAILSARELVAEAIISGNQTVPDVLVIADEEGHALQTVSCAAVVPGP